MLNFKQWVISRKPSARNQQAMLAKTCTEIWYGSTQQLKSMMAFRSKTLPVFCLTNVLSASSTKVRHELSGIRESQKWMWIEAYLLEQTDIFYIRNNNRETTKIFVTKVFCCVSHWKSWPHRRFLEWSFWTALIRRWLINNNNFCIWQLLENTCCRMLSTKCGWCYFLTAPFCNHL